MTAKTDSLEEVEAAENYGEVVQTRSGSYELHFPTKLNAELKPLIGKDLDMDVVKEGENLRVVLTDKTSQRELNLTFTHLLRPN